MGCKSSQVIGFYTIQPAIASRDQSLEEMIYGNCPSPVPGSTI